MNHQNPVMLAGFLALGIILMIGMNLNMRIRALLRTLYPEIAKPIGDGSMTGSSIDSSLALMKVIVRPPSEITYPPLLKLFRYWKILLTLQILIMLTTIFYGVSHPVN